MSNDVLINLQKMEEELAAIKSAKEQIETIVLADNAISSNIISYSTALSTLPSKLFEVKDSIKEVANSITDDASTFSNSLNDKKTDIENHIKRLSDLLDDFKNQIELIEIKTGQIPKICEGILTKQTQIEDTIIQTSANINQDITTSIKKEVAFKTEAIISNIDTKKSEVEDKFSICESNLKIAVTEGITNILNKLDTINSTINDVKESITDNKRGITELLTRYNKRLILFLVGIAILIVIDIILHFI